MTDYSLDTVSDINDVQVVTLKRERYVTKIAVVLEFTATLNLQIREIDTIMPQNLYQKKIDNCTGPYISCGLLGRFPNRLEISIIYNPTIYVGGKSLPSGSLPMFPIPRLYMSRLHMIK